MRQDAASKEEERGTWEKADDIICPEIEREYRAVDADRRRGRGLVVDDNDVLAAPRFW
jgi:hypothetical protein